MPYCGVAALLALGVLCAPSPGQAAEAAAPTTEVTAVAASPDVVSAKVCGQQWKAAKAAATLATGETWPRYLQACRKGAVPAAVTADPAPGAPAQTAAPAPADAQRQIASLTKQCGAKWQDAKAAGTVPSDQTWPQFLKLCSAASAPQSVAAITTVAASAADAPVMPSATTAKKLVKTANTGSSVAKACGEKWRAAKAAGAVVAGTTWPQYLKSCRSETVAGATKPAQLAVVKPATAAAATVDIDPATASSGDPAAAGDSAPAAASNSAAPPVSAKTKPAKAKTAKPLTAKQTLAFAATNARKKTCGAAWQQANAAGTIPAGQTWPKFWSECNTRLKAQGG